MLKLSLVKAILRAVAEHDQMPLGRPEIRARTGGTEEEVVHHLERLQEMGAFDWSVMDEMIGRETWAKARYQYRLSRTGSYLLALLVDAGE